MSSKRKGFTLIELLVVIAIISILMSLLVPAVQKVREAANETTCSNNLKQIGVALQSYHDVNRMFPVGSGSGTNPATAKADMSWSFHILPYLEQQALYDTYQAAVGPPANWVLLDAKMVPTYYCPSRRALQLYHGEGICDYAGNGGTDDVNGSDGVMVRTQSNNRIRMIALTDGSSNTMIVGERRINLAHIVSGTDSGDNEPCLRPAWDLDAIRLAQPVGASWRGPDQDLGTGTYQFGQASPRNWQFGSSHSVGINAVFCDGSVRKIGYGVDPVVFKNVCVRNDGQVLGNLLP